MFRKTFLTLSAIVLAGALEACDKPAPPLTDAQGRTVILHGVNISESAKRLPGNTSWHTYEDYARLREWGLTSIRLLVFWNALEPQAGVIYETYIDGIEERVGWARELGLSVILDLHQDIYSEKYTGDGAPEWACLDEGQPFEPVEPWWLRNLQPAVRTAWNNFWETPSLQDHYVDAFSHLVVRFVGDPTVLGYDLMNEPFGAYTPEEFETVHLRAFYQKVGQRLAVLDPEKKVFYEPLAPLNPGLPSQIGPMDGLQAVYYPHFYHLVVHEGLPYDGDPQPIRWAIGLRRQEAQQWKRPILFGEVGVIAGTENAAEYLHDLFDILDENRYGWFYWSYDRGSDRGFNLLDANNNEYPVVEELVRTYPFRTAGSLTKFHTNQADGSFEMKYVEVEGVTGATEIVVPPRRYPHGFRVESSDPSGSWSWTHDAVRHIVSVTANPAKHSHTVRIVPLP